jgi:hypothetical protein
MAEEEVVIGKEEQETPIGRLEAQILEFPTLALDEDQEMEDVENAAQEDIEANTNRRRRGPAARTLYHQPRGDDDTL